METIKKTTSFLEVLIFEPESDTITEALGITDERTDELIDILKKTITESSKTKENRITNDLYKMSIKVKHVNELTFLLFTYGKIVGEQETERKSGMSSSIFLDMFKSFGQRLPPDNTSKGEQEEEDSSEDL